MSIEIVILLGAILGAFGVFLAFQVRKLLVEKQVPLNDIDAIVKTLFELNFDRAFFAKLGIGTAIGAFGAFASLAAVAAGAPAGADVLTLLAYGFAWGFAGNGILYVLRLIPEDFITILKVNTEIKALRAENTSLKAQNVTLEKLNLSLGTNQGGQVQPPLK